MLYEVITLPLLTRITDGGGRAEFPRIEGFENEQAPTVYVVKTAGDLAFIPFERAARRMNFSRFEVDGVQPQGYGDNLSAFLFSDRGIYRPGERNNFV